MIGFEDPYDIQTPVLDADILSAYHRAVRNGLLMALAPPTVSVQRTTIQTVPDNTDTGIAADLLSWDSHVMHSVVGGVSRFTVPAGADGEILVGMNTNWQANNVGKRSAFIRHSDLGVVACATSPCGFDGYMQHNISTSVIVNAGTYFEFFVNQDCGAALNLEPVGSAAQVMWARWVRLVDTIAAA